MTRRGLMTTALLFVAGAVALYFGVVQEPVAAQGADGKKLLTPAQLIEMADGNVTILDIRGPGAYAEGHVDGAVNAPYGLWRGPREDPGRRLSDEQLTMLLQSLGVTPEKPVIVTYAGKSDTDFGAAARVYWTLKSAGVQQIAILNGGLQAWAEAGLTLSTDPVAAEPSQMQARLSDQWLLTRDGVLDVVEGRSDAHLVDARPLEFFEGDAKHGAAAQAGTLEGALNLVHSSWFGPDHYKMISTPEAAEEIARNAGYDGTPGDGEVLVSFCNTGHWAATNWFALSEIAGIENVKLYPESMVGWSNALMPMVNTGAEN